MVVVLTIISVFVITYVIRIIRRLKLNPHRPVIATVLDALLEPLQYFQIGLWGRPCDLENAIKIALSGSKTKDLSLFTESGSSKRDLTEYVSRFQTNRKIGLEGSKAKYSPAGHLVVLYQLADRVEVRLRFIDYIKKHPRILSMKVKAPVFVIGFTRTGTTFLHELLSLHKSVRSHHTWEQMQPVPDTHSEKPADLLRDRQHRYSSKKAVFNYILLPLIGEAMQHVHRIGYDDPEECTVPVSLELPWSLTELGFTTFAAKEMEAMGAGDAYCFYKQYLQLLAWQQRQSDSEQGDEFTWMLKCPFHLPFLKDLVEVFPDCSIVWTHRNPVECIGSACSLHQTLLRMFAEESSIDAAALGRALVNYTQLSLKSAEETLSALSGKIKVVHVRYRDVVGSSVASIRSILEQTGLPFTAEYEATVEAYLQSNAEQRKALKKRNEKKGAGKPKFHDYKLEDYGLNAEEVKSTFADYIKKYDL